MTDREEREEHIKRLEAALACEEKQFLGKCSKQTCDDNCALLYEQGNWGEWKETLRYAINSLKIDLKYDLLYEETSGHADKQADKPITQNCESCRYYGSRHKVCNYCYKCSLWTEQEPTTKNNLGVDCISRADAIKAMQDKAKKLTNEDTINGLCGAVAILFDLPPVTPQEPRKGHWIPVYQGDEIINYRCSECEFGNTFGRGTFGMNFCPRCGSDNREVEE